MSCQGVQQFQKTGFVGGVEKPHETFGFVVKRVHLLRRRMSHGDQSRQRNQVAGCDRIGVRLADVAARPLITGVRVFGNKLSESFIKPAGDSVRVKTMENKVDNLVTERVVGKFVCRIALNEEAAGGVNTAGPLFEMSEHLKLLPFFGTLENINVRFDIGGELIAFQFFCDDAVMELGLDGNWGCNV